LFDEESEV